MPCYKQQMEKRRVIGAFNDHRALEMSISVYKDVYPALLSR